ncbi:MAG: FAD-dependent oxidoreductase [Treponemataceae bacterium]
MKVIVLGCNHAGTFAATTIKKTFGDVEVVSYDRNDNISFLACGIALWVGGVVKDPKGLFYATPESLTQQGIKVNMGHEITKIDFAAKKVYGTKLSDKSTFEDSYDKLILAAGSWPVIPPFEGVNLKGVHLSKLYQHGLELIKEMENPKVKNVMVIGAGYIGVELFEAFKQNGKNIIAMEAMPRVMANYFDPEISCEAEKHIRNGGVDLHLNEKVVRFEGDANGHVNKVVTDKASYDVDAVVVSVGFRPNSELYKDTLTVGKNGGIIVNEYMQSSDPNVFAIGDCAMVHSNATQQSEYIALATNAVRMGIVAALNIKENAVAYKGTQGSNAICVFGYNMASTGLSEESCKMRGLDVKTSFVKDASRPEFMPSYTDVLVKMVYDAKTRRIIGAQIASEENHAEAIHAFSLAIQNGMTVEEFALSDFFFLPHFNKPVSWLTQVAYNVLGK